MKLRLLTIAVSAAVACAPMFANAGGVDCSAGALSDTCDLPMDTVITNPSQVTLTLTNETTPYIIAADDGGIGVGQTLGSLPFVILANAPAQSLIVTANGNIGMGTGSPTTPLTVRRKNNTAKILVREDKVATNPGAPQSMFERRRTGAVRFDLVDNSGTAVTWAFQNRDGNFNITKVGTGVQEFNLDGDGNLTIQGALLQLSDVNAKKDFQKVSGASVLDELNRLPILKWTYKADSSGSRHIGPTAQDFYKVFNIGKNNTSIAPLDVASVAVAGVKELHAMVDQQRAELAAKDSEIAAMNKRMSQSWKIR